MPEAALQPFVTSQRPSGVASRAAPQEPATHWTWQATPNPTIEAGWTTTSPARLGDIASSEQNKLGSYYCWNRIYEPSTGRWTTPDPAAKPWSNLVDYASSSSLSATDPSGLASGWTSRNSTGAADGVAGYSYSWEYEIDVNKYAAGYRIFQWVAIMRTWTFCDGVSVSLQSMYLETSNSRKAKDNQETSDPAGDGEDAKSGMQEALRRQRMRPLRGTRDSDCPEKVESYTESRLNRIFLAKPTAEASRKMANGSTVYVDLVAGAGLPNTVNDHYARANDGTDAATGFEFLGTELADIAVQGSGLVGSGSSYGLMYFAKFGCCSGDLVEERLRVHWHKEPTNNIADTWPRD